MSNTSQLQIFLSLFAANLPTLLACAVAVIVVMIKWRHGSSGSLWALIGFGLALILCIVIPLAHTLLQQWVLQDGERFSRMWAFSALGLINSMLHAVIYVFLLVAIFAGRPRPMPAETKIGPRP